MPTAAYSCGEGWLCLCLCRRVCVYAVRVLRLDCRGINCTREACAARRGSSRRCLQARAPLFLCFLLICTTALDTKDGGRHCVALKLHSVVPDALTFDVPRGRGPPARPAFIGYLFGHVGHMPVLPWLLQFFMLLPMALYVHYHVCCNLQGFSICPGAACSEAAVHKGASTYILCFRCCPRKQLCLHTKQYVCGVWWFGGRVAHMQVFI